VCGAKPNRIDAAGQMQPHHIYAGICIDISDLWTIPVTEIAGINYRNSNLVIIKNTFIYN
jgi:hypothetical protein